MMKVFDQPWTRIRQVAIRDPKCDFYVRYDTQGLKGYYGMTTYLREAASLGFHLLECDHPIDAVLSSDLLKYLGYLT